VEPEDNSSRIGRHFEHFDKYIVTTQKIFDLLNNNFKLSKLKNVIRVKRHRHKKPVKQLIS
jgi:hypothetical protein